MKEVDGFKFLTIGGVAACREEGFSVSLRSGHRAAGHPADSVFVYKDNETGWESIFRVASRRVCPKGDIQPASEDLSYARVAVTDGELDSGTDVTARVRAGLKAMGYHIISTEEFSKLKTYTGR